MEQRHGSAFRRTLLDVLGAFEVMVPLARGHHAGVSGPPGLLDRPPEPEPADRAPRS